MSTAFFHRQSHVQRLRGKDHASKLPGSRRRDPGALRPERRPERHNNLSGKQQKPPILLQERRETPYDLGLCKCGPKAKTAAPRYRASSLTALFPNSSRTCRLEALAGHTPPLRSSQPRAPPARPPPQPINSSVHGPFLFPARRRRVGKYREAGMGRRSRYQLFEDHYLHWRPLGAARHSPTRAFGRARENINPYTDEFYLRPPTSSICASKSAGSS